MQSMAEDISSHFCHWAFYSRRFGESQPEEVDCQQLPHLSFIIKDVCDERFLHSLQLNREIPWLEILEEAILREH